MTYRLIAAYLVSSFLSVSICSADKLCLKSTLNNKTLKIKNTKVIASTCPRGYTELVDTSIFKGDIGDTGPKGAKGDAGVQGAKGDNGASAYDTMPSGTTVRGVLSVTRDSFTAISFPAPIPQELTNNDVMIVVTAAVNPTNGCTVTTDCISSAEIAKAIPCTGTADLPTAPAGKVCIYPKTFVRFGADQPASSSVFPYVNTSSTSIYGFRATAGDYMSFTGTWAYTAP
jgi:hypothetical protein